MYNFKMTNTFHPILPSSPGLGQRHAHRRRLHRHPRIQQRQKRRVPRAGRHGAVTAAELNDDLGKKRKKKKEKKGAELCFVGDTLW